MFSMDLSSPVDEALIGPDVVPVVVVLSEPPIGVGEPVGGLGGGDLGLNVRLPGVTVSKAEPCDGAGKL